MAGTLALRRALVVGVFGALGAWLVLAGTAQAAPGDLSLIDEPDGCLTETGLSDRGLLTCNQIDVRGGGGGSPTAIGGTLAPDGAHAYLSGAGRLTVLHRDPATGGLSAASCWDDVAGGACESPPDGEVRGAFDPTRVLAVGDDVYTFGDELVVHFDAEGDELDYVGCMGAPAACLDADGLASSTFGGPVAASPSGEHVVVAHDAYPELFVVDRDPETGVLSQPATPSCASDDGMNRYSAAPAPGDCLAPAGNQSSYTALAFSPDGKQLYAGGSNGISALGFGAADGDLSQASGTAGCLSWIPGTPCEEDPRVGPIRDLAIAADGENLYATSVAGEELLLAIARDEADGSIAVVPGAGGCAEFGTDEVPDCPETSPGAPERVAVAPDGDHVYVVHRGFENFRVQGWNRAASGGLSVRSGAGACASYDGSGGECAVHELPMRTDPVFDFTPDGRHLYYGGGGYPVDGDPTLPETGLYSLLHLEREPGSGGGPVDPGPTDPGQTDPDPTDPGTGGAADDSAGPQVTIESPAVGQIFIDGERVEARYRCTDETHIASCDAPGATSQECSTSRREIACTARLHPVPMVDRHSFRVTARDGAGHETSTTHGYFVDLISRQSIFERFGAAVDEMTGVLEKAKPKLSSSGVAKKGTSLGLTADKPGTTFSAGLIAPAGKGGGIANVPSIDKLASSGVLSTYGSGILSTYGSGVVSTYGSGLVADAKGKILSTYGGGLTGFQPGQLLGAAAGNRASGSLTAERQAGGAPNFVAVATGTREFAQPGSGKLKVKASKAGRKALGKSFGKRGTQKVKLLQAVSVATPDSGVTITYLKPLTISG